MRIIMSNIIWDFSNKNVLVVGSSRGIGKGVVDEFNKSGANVIELESKYCDLRYKEEIDAFTENLPTIDILINVAAINHPRKIEDITWDEWTDVMDVNLRGIFYITQIVLMDMRDGGKIVNVSSIAGRHRSLTSGAHYTTSKAGLIGLTKQIAFQVGERNINVNAVCPSQTDTDMLRASMTKEKLRHLESTIPLGRISSVQEQVHPIMFLCSSEASYITGTTLDVNGGQL
jgi:NAD(P)-dependent dehydrogenase (short-subunit alcohol dehydrogenase family)